MSQTSCPTCGILNGPALFTEAPTSLRALDLLSTNVPPHDAEVDDLRQIVHNSSALVQSLQDHINKVQDTLSTLQAMHQTASRRLADAKRILHPIRSLPGDILSEIFLLCTPIAEEPDDEPFEYGPAFDTLCPRNHPWNLSHVSHSWREVALSLPRLWSTVYLNFAQYKQLSYRQCMFKSTLLFERSANLDLSMTITSDAAGIAYHPMMGCLEASTTRWRTLRCRIPSSSLQALSGSTFPLLEELGIGYCSGPGGHALVDVFRRVPNIRTVEFYYSDCGINSYTVLGAFPWNNVKHLLCYTYSIRSPLRSILDQATNLEDLTLAFGVIFSDFFRGLNFISLPFLHQLDLTECEDADAGCNAEFLVLLRIPAIRRLTLTFFPGQYVSFRALDFHPDVRRITTLRITCSMATLGEEDDTVEMADGVEMLLKFLRMTSGVEDFYLVDDNIPVEFLRAFITDGTEAGTVVLPSLRSLDLGGCESAAADETLNEALLLLAESRLKFAGATDLEDRSCHTLERMVLPTSWNVFECSPDDEHRDRWTALCWKSFASDTTARWHRTTLLVRTDLYYFKHNRTPL